MVPGTCGFGKRAFADVIKFIDFKIGRLSWTVWMGLIEAHEPLIAGNFSGWGQRDVVKDVRALLQREGFNAPLLSLRYRGLNARVERTDTSRN